MNKWGYISNARLFQNWSQTKLHLSCFYVNSCCTNVNHLWTMSKLQREADVANVLSQMSQLVHQPSEIGSVTSKEDLEHTYAQNLTNNSGKSERRSATGNELSTIGMKCNKHAIDLFVSHSKIFKGLYDRTQKPILQSMAVLDTILCVWRKKIIYTCVQVELSYLKTNIMKHILLCSRVCSCAWNGNLLSDLVRSTATLCSLAMTSISSILFLFIFFLWSEGLFKSLFFS